MEPPSRDAKHAQENLVTAATKGNLEMMETALQHGAAINEGFGTGKVTALHAAVKNRNAEAVEFLLDKGASMSAEDASGQTPLHIASASGLVAETTMILKRLGTERGANVNQKDNHGNTALHLAAKPEIAEMLILAGGDPNATNNKNETPGHVTKNAEVRAMLSSSDASQTTGVESADGETGFEPLFPPDELRILDDARHTIALQRAKGTNGARRESTGMQMGPLFSPEQLKLMDESRRAIALHRANGTRGGEDGATEGGTGTHFGPLYSPTQLQVLKDTRHTIDLQRRYLAAVKAGIASEVAAITKEITTYAKANLAEAKTILTKMGIKNPREHAASGNTLYPDVTTL